jgi:hypothetical protein
MPVIGKYKLNSWTFMWLVLLIASNTHDGMREQSHVVYLNAGVEHAP